MNDTTVDLDQTDEEALTYEEVSDEALEAAATGSDSGNGKPTSSPQCCSYGRC